MRPLSILLLALSLGLAHCSSDDNGGGGGGTETDTPTDTGPSCVSKLDASMTVGVGTSAIPFGYGTIAGGLYTATGGMLSEDAFELNGTTYTISGLIGIDDSTLGTQGDIFLALAEGMIPSGATANLVLQLDSRKFVFSSGGLRFDSTFTMYRQDDISPRLSWSAMDTVSVKLCVNE